MKSSWRDILQRCQTGVKKIGLRALSIGAGACVLIAFTWVNIFADRSVSTPFSSHMNHTTPSIYDFSAQRLSGQPFHFEHYRGKVLLVVNTASRCGFTPQYAGLQELYEKYNDKGLEIAAFPCNQFGRQEPGSNASIAKGCVVNYGVTFPLFAKVDVNGKHAHPLFTFLKSQKSGRMGKRIWWNFTKFLIDRNGTVVKRFSPSTTPQEIAPELLNYL